MNLPRAHRVPPGQDENQDHAVYALTLDPDLLAFQGHFPGQPILPGVVQVDWAIQFGVKAFGTLGTFTGIRNLKFFAIIAPGELVELRLDHEPALGELTFSFHGPSSRKSTGTIRFASGGN